MKTRFLVLSLAILPMLAFSQFFSSIYKCSTSQPYGVVDASNKLYFSKGNEVMMIKMSGRGISVQLYDLTKKEEIHKKMLPPIEPGGRFLEFIEIDNNHYLFYTKKDIESKIESLYYMALNFEHATLDDPELLIEVEGSIGPALDFNWSFGGMSVSPSSEYMGGKFNFSTSFDKSKLVVHYRRNSKETDDALNYDTIGLNVFDSDLNEIWSDEFDMPYTESIMNNVDFDVDSKGKVYILVEVFHSEEAKKFVDNKLNFHYELLTFSNSRTKIIDLQEEYVYHNSIVVHETGNGDMSILGYYNDGIKNLESDVRTVYTGDVNGVFLIKLNSEGALMKPTYHKFPIEIINQGERKYDKKKNSKFENQENVKFENLKLQEVVFGDDGSFLFIGEEIYSNSYTNSTFHHYHDLMLTKLNSDGEIAWMKKLPKRQKSAHGTRGFSYEYFYKNGNHYLFYLDQSKNILLGLDQVPAYFTDDHEGILMVYKVSNANSEVTKSPILNTKKIEMEGVKKLVTLYQFSFDRFVETESGIVFETYKKGKQDIMIHVEFE